MTAADARGAGCPPGTPQPAAYASTSPAPAPRHPYRLGAVKAGDHVTEQVYRGDFA